MVTKASSDQIKRAADLIKRVDLKDFSVCQLTNPGKPLLSSSSLLPLLDVWQFCIYSKLHWFL